MNHSSSIQRSRTVGVSWKKEGIERNQCQLSSTRRSSEGVSLPRPLSPSPEVATLAAAFSSSPLQHFDSPNQLPSDIPSGSGVMEDGDCAIQGTAGGSIV